MDWRLTGLREMILHEAAQPSLIGLPARMAAAPAGHRLGWQDENFSDDPDDTRWYGPPPWVPDSEGIITLRVRGLLVPTGLWYCDYLTSYDAIDLVISRAEARGDVRGVLMLVDSPGGAAAGCFSCSERLRSSPLPIAAAAAPEAYSGGYALACAADRLFVPKDGGLGSIGVIQVHQEISRMLTEAGVTTTVFRAGERKARPNMLEPLDDTDRADIKTEISAVWSDFIGLVAAHRGLSSTKIQGLQARCLSGPAAVSAGLADALGGAPQARDWLKTQIGDTSMSNPAGGAAPGASAGTAADSQSLSDRLAAQIAAAREAGRKEGVAAERERAAGIVALCDVAQMPKRAAGLITDGSALEAAAVSLQRARADASDAAGGPVDPGQPGTGQGLAGKPPSMSIDAYVAANKIGGKTNG